MTTIRGLLAHIGNGMAAIGNGMAAIGIGMAVFTSSAAHAAATDQYEKVLESPGPGQPWSHDFARAFADLSALRNGDEVRFLSATSDMLGELVRSEQRPNGQTWYVQARGQPAGLFILTFEHGAFSGGGWSASGTFDLYVTGMLDEAGRPAVTAVPRETPTIECCTPHGHLCRSTGTAPGANQLPEPRLDAAGDAQPSQPPRPRPTRTGDRRTGDMRNAPGHGCECADDADRVDVLVVYTPLARVAAGGVAPLHARIQNAFDAANAAFQNSAVGPLRVEPAAFIEVEYDEVAPDFLEHLRRVTNPADGYMDGVHALRDAHQADTVALFVDDPRFTGGAGWFSVYDDQSAFTCTNWRAAGGGSLTFAHELGHNFGCDHNREAAGFPPFSYAYGHYFTAAGTTYGTIMSYVGQPIPYFSNPALTHGSGAPLGVPLSAAAPSANALVIANTRWALANFRISGRGRDCNGNGIADELDIASGFSLDLNGNCRPDECERTLYVDAGVPVAGDGSSWSAAFRDLSLALEIAHVPCSDVAEIWVAQGVYHPDRGTGDRYAVFRLRDGLALYGGFQGVARGDGGETERAQRDPAAYPTMLSGDLGIPGDPDDNSFTILEAIDVGANAVLDGFIIADGNSPWTAGGLLGIQASPTIRNCVFRDHQARDSAAVHLREGGQARFENCRFLNNISRDGAGAVVLDVGAAATFVEAHFEGNTSAWAGGAVAGFSGTQCDLERCTFRSNAAVYGGALAYGEQASGLIRDCEFTENSASGHGGALALYDAAPVFRDCLLAGNTAPWGGALHTAAGATPVFVLCEFTLNRSAHGGGALRGAGGVGLRGTRGAVRLYNCRLTRNQAEGSGGALDGWNSDWYLYNSLLSENTARWDGGALAGAGNSTALLVNCTITNNQATQGVGGGLALFGSTLGLHNSILWENDHPTPQLQDRQLTLFQASATVAHSCIQGWTGALGGIGNIGLDPGFADRAGGDLRLTHGSPAIDAARTSDLPADVYDLDQDGDLTELLPLDLAGLPRFQDDPATLDCSAAPGSCGPAPLADMGAYEFAGVAALPGDLNCDGAVNFDDIGAFVTALVGVSAYEAAFPACRWLNGDIDGSGSVDFNDIDGFIGCLIAGGC